MTFYYPSSQRTVPLLLGALVVGPLFEEMFYRYTLIYTGRKKMAENCYDIVQSFVVFVGPYC